jgi:DNA-directed RNA polymerase subunit RPC12/RpoP
MPISVTCRCQTCSGNIEFDPSLLQTGTMVTCPHCGLETAVFIPQAPRFPKPESEPLSDGDSSSGKWAACICNKCSGRLEFDPNNVGETIQCPHCGMETVLPKPEPKRAEIVEQTTYKDTDIAGRLEFKQIEPNRSRNVEEQLEAAGQVFLVVGLIVGTIALAVVLLSAINQGSETSINSKAPDIGLWLIVGAAAVVQGFVIRLLFVAGAEIIRLLKDSNRLRFTGKITQLSVHRSYKCSRCNATAKPTQVRCSRCGAEFFPLAEKDIERILGESR